MPLFLDTRTVSYFAPKVHWLNQFERAECLTGLGCDPMINIWLPTPEPSNEVDIKVLREKKDGKIFLTKEFHTPAGVLKQTLHETEDWCDYEHVYWVQQTLGSGDRQDFGMHVFDDWNVSRRTEPWVKGREDLEKLKYVLKKPADWKLEEWRHDTQRAIEYAKKHGLLTCVRRTIVSDANQWFCDIPWFMMQLYDDPGFVEEFLAIFEDVARWQAELVLEMKPDLFQRRGWYDIPDFWGGSHYEKYILPSINREADRVHEAGCIHAYLLTEGWGAYLKTFKKLKTDLMWGLDPYMCRADLHEIKKGIGGKKTILGGVSFERDLLMSTPEDAKKAISRVIGEMAPGGGFILAVAGTFENIGKWENVEAMIAAAQGR
jgi:hypothetical protein